MPIYEYECLDCGTRFEKRQGFHEESQADCPHGHEKTRRVFAPPAIVFKGSGFYVTDSRKVSNGASKNANGESKSSETKDSPASSTKSKEAPPSKKE